MKIDKRNLRHWVYLVLSFCNVMMALVLRPLYKRRRRKLVVLYGHKLTGNLLALYRASDPSAWDTVFLTMDPSYHQELRALGHSSVLATSAHAIAVLAGASAVVSDHGLHAMLPLLRLSDIRFFDVWHGIPFKGFDASDFKVQRGYHETWLPSPLMARLYVDRFGFDPARVAVTGYARTDRLVSGNEDKAFLRQAIGAPAEGPLVLFAPTWAQDSAGRSIYPFGHSDEEFLSALSECAGRFGATVLLRTHLNSNIAGGGNYANVLHLPFGRYPDTEGILLISDMLVCDWSSIAFDYLLLDRPAVFLDVPAPFRKGFSLGPEFRYGALAPSLEATLGWIGTCLSHPDDYWSQYRARHAEVRRCIYGDFADGHAAMRCLQRLHMQVGQAKQ